MKTIIKTGNYKTADEVEIEIIRTVPQPDVEEVNVYSVKRIKKEIIECDEKIVRLTARKADLEKVLKDNATAITNSVL